MTTGMVALTSRARYGEAMSRTATASLVPRATVDVQRVTRSWKTTITTGFMAKSTPQTAGERPWVCVSETGASSSKAAYVHQPAIVAKKTAMNTPWRSSGRIEVGPAVGARRALSGSRSAAPNESA
jgi:hypothetical protein